MESNIALIGFRGVGKTSVARSLAERLGRPWVDADEEIQRQAGITIAEIFSRQGEDAFRDLESQVLRRLCDGGGRILALGGGAVLRRENRRMIARATTAVWLRADAETIFPRLASDPATATQRPDLTELGGMREIRELLAEREPIYRQCAQLVVDTQEKRPDQIAAEIQAGLQQQRP